MSRLSILLCSESSHRGDDARDCIVKDFAYCVYEYFVMYICIRVYSLKRNYVGFDPQWTRYVGGRLKPGSSPIFWKKNIYVHGIEEGLNVLMELKKVWIFLCFEVNEKYMYVYCVWLGCGWSLEMFLNVSSRFCKFGKVRKTEETLSDFLKKKTKFGLALRFRNNFSKNMLRIVKGFAPWILIYDFMEKFLYPLECREVPSGSWG